MWELLLLVDDGLNVVVTTVGMVVVTKTTEPTELVVEYVVATWDVVEDVVNDTGVGEEVEVVDDGLVVSVGVVVVVWPTGLVDVGESDGVGVGVVGGVVGVVVVVLETGVVVVDVAWLEVVPAGGVELGAKLPALEDMGGCQKK
jgi:hypothetical protein